MQGVCMLLTKNYSASIFPFCGSSKLSSLSLDNLRCRLFGTSSGDPPAPSSNSLSAEALRHELNQRIEQQAREWGEQRKSRLTASVFCHAIGFWKGRRVQLWEEKIGLREPFQGNLATNWGVLKEATAIQRYKELTKNEVKHLLFKSYPVGTSMPDWMGASPDGLIDRTPTLLLENGGILEVKCPFNKGRPDRGVPWPYVPHYYVPQAQGLMEIFDRDWMDFYVWTMNGSSVFRIQRDTDLWELMLTALNDFWWVHVVPARHLLSKDIKADVKRYKPSPHHGLYLTISRKCKLLAEKSPLVSNEVRSRFSR